MPNEHQYISQRSSTRRANQVRWAWLLTTLILAAALVVGSWVSYRGAVDAITTLNRGQAYQFEFALRAVSGPGGSRLDAAILQAFFEEHRGAGLRYAAVLDPEGATVISAGEPAAAVGTPQPHDRESGGDPRAAGGNLIQVGNRMRATFPRPPLRTGAATQPSYRDGPPMGYWQVLEFEPMAPELVARAQRTLGLAAVGATILTLATLLFWRTSRRYDAIRLRLEEQRRLTVLGEMSAVLAHEIRNPLASLKGHAQLLTERLSETSPERRKADRIVDEAKRLEVLTSDLLDFARSGPMDIREERPADVLRASIEDVGHEGIEIDTTNAPATWRLDKRRMAHAVLGNLIRNAAQALPARRNPVARVFSENGQLVFTVRDYGPGILQEVADRIFDPFFTTRTAGSGLGLPVARRIVELHGGRIVVANAPDGGAEFRVELPPKTA